ncbi:MAG: hypothetical protein DRJ31_03535 [Candidatus Methanomethylicota archaeon]|uniref:Uncharacterized protein n=1 Tax=Thermoproteota archaeon TaxID=2056631 RepID=A0A497ERF9_9CREN|nr:MAG: hypothetical protein DRJ31_03535 [Candidatus Verstraetearchaeota archaeon]
MGEAAKEIKPYYGALPPLKPAKEVPSPKGVMEIMGPGWILVGLSIGSGELLMWPTMTMQFGYILLWAMLLGVTLQFFWNTELVRWTVITGESYIQGMARMPPGPKFWVPWFLLIGTWGFIWPGWGMGAGDAMWLMFGGWGDPVAWRTLGFIFCLIVILAGKIVREPFEKIMMIVSIWFTVTLIVSAIYLIAAMPPIEIELLVHPSKAHLVDKIIELHPDWYAELAAGGYYFIHTGQYVTVDTRALVGTYIWGLFGGGAGLIPWEKVDYVLLGAGIAYAGAGGIYNVYYSYWARDKGWGMGQYIGRIAGIRGKLETVSDVGFWPEPTPENISRLKKWIFNYEWKENFLIWYVLDAATLILFTFIAGAIFYYPYMTDQVRALYQQVYAELGDFWNPLNKDFVTGTLPTFNPIGMPTKHITGPLGEARMFQLWMGPAGWWMFMIMAAMVLWSTHISILEGGARMWADSIWCFTPGLREKKPSIRFWYYLVFFIFFIWGLIIIWTRMPTLRVLAIGASIQLAVQWSSVITVPWMYKKLIPKELYKDLGPAYWRWPLFIIAFGFWFWAFAMFVGRLAGVV